MSITARDIKGDVAMATTIFLTDGTQFLGPYETGDFAIARGRRTLEENHGATEVFSIQADTLMAAKQAWAKQQKEVEHS